MILGKGDYISQVLGIINGGDYGKGSVYRHWYRQTSTDSHIVRRRDEGAGVRGQACYFKKKKKEHLLENQLLMKLQPDQLLTVGKSQNLPGPRLLERQYLMVRLTGLRFKS